MHHLGEVLISWGPIGLLILATLESAGPPTPAGTDFVLVFLTAARPSTWLLCALLTTVGSLTGSAIFFEVVRRGGEKFLRRYTSSGRGARFRGWFQRYGLLTVFVSALVPVPILPFKVFVTCAAAMGVSRLRYMSVLAAARIPRYLGLAFLGSQLGAESWPWVKDHKWHMLGAAVFLFASLYLVIRWVNRTQPLTQELQ
jgi:membrane protein DedA with SNARE-associated domain